MDFDLDRLVRPNIRSLVPYSSARDEFGGSGRVFLDANENAFGSPLADDHSRYPDPLQTALKQKIGELNEIDPAKVFVGHGSDEAIDLLIRVFCRPGTDNIVICPPTYGVYEVAAAVNDVAVRRAGLDPDFSLNVRRTLSVVDEYTKLIFICSPNNPTGNLMDRASILAIADRFDGIVVVDEAYIHFADEESIVTELDRYSNLVELQTLSKAWGLAGLRIGFAFAGAAIIDLLNKVKAPYNISDETQRIALRALGHREIVAACIAEIRSERFRLENELRRFSFVEQIFPSDANFLLVKTTSPREIYQFLLALGIVVRDRSGVAMCEGCLRVTVGTKGENEELIAALNSYEKSPVY